MKPFINPSTDTTDSSVPTGLTGSADSTRPPSYVKLNGSAGKSAVGEPVKSSHTG
jgi:hypothetical protein